MPRIMPKDSSRARRSAHSPLGRVARRRAPDAVECVLQFREDRGRADQQHRDADDRAEDALGGSLMLSSSP